LSERLTEVQHQYYAAIMSIVQMHLDHDNCLEVILGRSKSSLVHDLAITLIAVKGLKYDRFTITTSGRDLNASRAIQVLPLAGVCLRSRHNRAPRTDKLASLRERPSQSLQHAFSLVKFTARSKDTPARLYVRPEE
jgi:hypothetical protein